MMRHFQMLPQVLVLILVFAYAVSGWATPYASNVTKTGTTVNFVLNEAADSLTYSVNGGAPQPLTPTKGAKTFSLTSPTDTFSIEAEKNAATGYKIPTGNQITGSIAAPTNEGGLNLISDDTNPLTRYQAPRGVAVSGNPNTANFGTVYIANAAVGTTADAVRTLGDGLYALRADQTDAFGYGDLAQNPPAAPDGFPSFSEMESDSPYRISVGVDGKVYVADLSDTNSNVIAVDSDLLNARSLFIGFVGTSGSANADGTSLTPEMNHGSVASAVTTGSLETNDLVVYTLDEDMTTAHVTGDLGQSTTDKYSLWRYALSGNSNPVSTMPTKVATGITPAPMFADMDRGTDGKFYLSVNAAASPVKLVVTDPSGAAVYDSLTASQALGNPSDILTNLNQIAVSPDQKWLAGLLNSSDVLVLPLVNGIPDLASRLVIVSGTASSAGDIAFDAANNIHFVTSGDERYRVLSPGGHTVTTLAWNGTAFTFGSSTVAGGVAGDYNSNGVVDAADYVVWRNAAANATLPNDLTPGTVDASDYSTWRANFGKTPGTGSGAGVNGVAVPEPAGAALLLVAAIFFAGTRRRTGTSCAW